MWSLTRQVRIFESEEIAMLRDATLATTKKNSLQRFLKKTFEIVNDKALQERVQQNPAFSAIFSDFIQEYRTTTVSVIQSEQSQQSQPQIQKEHEQEETTTKKNINDPGGTEKSSTNVNSNLIFPEIQGMLECSFGSSWNVEIRTCVHEDEKEEKEEEKQEKEQNEEKENEEEIQRKEFSQENPENERKDNFSKEIDSSTLFERIWKSITDVWKWVLGDKFMCDFIGAMGCESGSNGIVEGEGKTQNKDGIEGLERIYLFLTQITIGVVALIVFVLLLRRMNITFNSKDLLLITASIDQILKSTTVPL